MVSFGYNSACHDIGEDSTAAEQLQVTLKGCMVPLLGSLKTNLLRQQPPACMSQFLSLLATVSVGRESGIGYTNFCQYNPFIVMVCHIC